MKRILSFLAILVVVFVCSRALVRALPGDPLETLIAESGTSIPVELLRRELHLDRPFLPAIWADLRRAIQGDLGISLFSKQPIGGLVFQRFLNTLALTSTAFLLAVLISLPLGVLAAGHRTGQLESARLRRWSRLADPLCSFHGGLMAALPIPWLGPILAYALAVRIPLFPLGGHLALPSFVLALGLSALWARLIRERVSETLSLDSPRAARARGAPEWLILAKYGLIPASGSIAAFLGGQVGALLAGAFITEVIFDWPGLGSLFIEAVLRRDYPVVEAAAFVGAATSLAGIRIGDWIHRRIDPRLA